MSEKKGIVISIRGKYADLLTPYGEFVKVDCNGKKPNIGEKFVGNEVQHKFFHFNTRGIVAAACIMFILFIGGGVKAYYSSSATVLVNINPHIELKVNFLNRIIFSKALNDDGSKILSQVKINNTNINDGLEIIIDQSKKDKFIDENYIKTKTISIDINGKNINISKFKSNMAVSDLSIKIQSNGNVILNKNSNKKLNKNSSKKLNKSSSNNSNIGVKNTDGILNNGKSSSNKSNYKKSNSNSFPKKNVSAGGNNSVSSKNNDKGESDSKQPQYSNSNKIKENQNPDKKTDNYKSKDNDHHYNSNKSNTSGQNSSANRHK